MTSAPAVVIGPGNVGCGIVATALQADHHPYVLVARTAGAAQRLQQHGVRVGFAASPDRPATVLRPADVIALDDPALVAAIDAAPMVFVAVGSGQARTLVPALAHALAARSLPAPVMVCDNRAGAAAALQALVAEHVLTATAPHRFAGVLVDRIANRVAEDPRRILVEGPGGLLVDRTALRGAVPELAGLRGVDDFDAHLARKKFIFSAGHAAAAYLGGLAGHTTLPEALADRDVATVVRSAMREGQAGAAARFGPLFGADEQELEATLQRFRCPALADPVARVGRDPRRKLTGEDRICGPALAALASGTTPAALAVTAAAALAWGPTLDPDLGPLLSRIGPRRLLARLAPLPEHHPFAELVEQASAVLTYGGTATEALESAGGLSHGIRRW